MSENQDYIAQFFNEAVYLLAGDQIQDSKPQTSSVAEKTAIEKVSHPVFKSKIALILDKDINSEEKIFLEKILKAVSLDFTKVEILKSEQIISYEKISFEQIIDFGTNILIDQVKYEITTYKGADILKADEIDKIARDQILKRVLWNSLKKLFGIA